MPPLQQSDIVLSPHWRLDRFWSGGAELFWGAVFLWLSWLAADPDWQFGSWLTIINGLPVPNRVLMLLTVAVLLVSLGVVDLARAFRSPVAILSWQAVSFPTVFGWRRIAWKDVARVTLHGGRQLTFEISASGGRKQETVDLFRTKTSGPAIARAIAAVRPDLVAGWPRDSSAPDPFRQERDFGHYIWP
jgi:hypothetical protein